MENHTVHPDYNCPLSLSDFAGCRFESSWLDKAVSNHISDFSLEETLIWLVYDQPEEFILLQRVTLAEDEIRIGDKADDLPLFKSVSGRQKRRKLVAECGLTIRDLKQLYATRRAKLMMVAGGKTVAQIASELGFADRATFRRLFKRMTGHTPIDFIKSPEFEKLKAISCLINTLREIS